MSPAPTVSVQAVVPNDARAEITAIGLETVTVHPTGALGQPSLHWPSFEALVDWYADLGEKLGIEERRRGDIARSISQARHALAGAR